MKNARTLSLPEAMSRFVKVQMEWEKKDSKWNPTKEELEARLDQLDTDKDGKLSEQEGENRLGPMKARRARRRTDRSRAGRPA